MKPRSYVLVRETSVLENIDVVGHFAAILPYSLRCVRFFCPMTSYGTGGTFFYEIVAPGRLRLSIRVLRAKIIVILGSYTEKKPFKVVEKKFE